jgi:NitT/TauT family transport system substrate-binding protein
LRAKLTALIGCLFLALSPAALVAAPAALKVGYDSWVGHIGVFVAAEKGFFDKQGVHVDLRAFSGPADTIPPAVAGDLDVALTTPETVLSVDARQKAELINVAMIDLSTGADAVVVRNDIHDVAGLRGKTIAVTFGQCNELLLLKALAAVGLKETDVTLINMDGDTSGAAFVAGRLDAAVTWEPWVSQVTSTGKGHVVFSTRDVPDVIFDSVAVTRRFAALHADRIEAFLRGLDAGVSYARSHPAESQMIVARRLSVAPAEVAIMLKGVTVYDLKDNLTLFGTSARPGRIYAAMDKVASFQVEHHLYGTRVPSATMLAPTYLMEAARSR